MYSFDELKTIANRAKLIGMKAENLIRLREGSFPVPDGFVLTAGELVSFSEEELAAYADPSVSYAVRSSGIGEDLAGVSFGGQFDSFLNVKGLANLREAIRKCASFLQDEHVIVYAKSKNIDLATLKMAVIVQEMIPGEKAGIASSIDSTSGRDTEILIEAVAGFGDALMQGSAKLHAYSYDWYHERFIRKTGDLLSEDEVRRISEMVLDIQIYYGFPVDVEWAITGEKIHILQSSPITTITYHSIPGEWSTAIFRDGGVSTGACKALMGSLYGRVFQAAFLDSLKTNGLLGKNYEPSIYEIFFARPYWFLSLQKECFAKLPGFVEGELDRDMGVAGSYEGDDVVTKTTLKTMGNAVRSLTAIKKHIKFMEKNTTTYKDDFLQRFEQIDQLNLTNKTAEELHKIWLDFVKQDYYASEYTYFSYIFYNTVLSALFRDKIKKYLPTEEITNLMSGLSNVSHMRPIYDMWEMSRGGGDEFQNVISTYEHDTKQKSDPFHKKGGDGFYHILETYKTYFEKQAEAGASDWGEDFSRFIKAYKYHSQHELDISYPNWEEKPDVPQKIIAHYVTLEDGHNPHDLIEKQRQKYLDTRRKLPEKLHKDVGQLRNFLWWREEFRDISSRAYYLIRRLTLALGRAWEKIDLLDAADDIFYLTVSDIEEKQDLKKIAEKNKKYYRSFRRFQSPGEIGNRHSLRTMPSPGSEILKGITCGGETITATARVISDIHDVDRLRPGDILVTKSTDPAWTAVFSKISGVITETGGMLSHAAVISREYGIACIMVVNHATEAIKDGQRVTMNCKTGEIQKSENSGTA
ncbi:phosphoenolpyruvate synthase [Clostridia bacterium]|nr:phosphoenolpyruvate synthase [Clostridia bacterium]